VLRAELLSVLTAATVGIQLTDKTNHITQPNNVSSPRPDTNTVYNLNTDPQILLQPSLI